MTKQTERMIAAAIDDAEEVRDSSADCQPHDSNIAHEGRFLITVVQGNLDNSISQAVEALKESRVQLFDRGGAAYRLVRTREAATDPSIRRPQGSLHLQRVSPSWFERRLSEIATWQRYDRRTKKMVPIDPQRRVALILQETSDEDGWPHLKGIVQHPLLTEDNRLITSPGYDPGTCLFVDVTGDWPIPPRIPSRDEAIAAVRSIEQWLRHFPFVSAGDRSVVLSMMLTALIRPTLPSAPAHCIDAPEAGTGKSLLVDATAILVTGKTAPVMDYGNDPQEATKRLDSMLLAGDAIIAIDNVEAPLDGAALCQTLTQETRRIRPLGASVMETVPCSALITVTGNNLIVIGDMVRRSLVCRLDAGTERPEMRHFEQDLLSEARARRGELVKDLLTILRAYAAAGYPGVEAHPLGSFERWSRRVRSALVWAGAKDPVHVMERMRTVDPDREAQQELFEAWFRTFGEEGATVREVKKRVGVDDELAAAIEKIGALRRGELDTRALGNWLRGKLDSRSGSLVLQKESGRSGYTRWIVAPYWTDGESDDSGESVPTDSNKVSDPITDTFHALVAGDSPDSPDSPDSGLSAVRAEPCNSCRQNRWWNNNGQQVCAVCHPPTIDGSEIASEALSE